MKKWLLVLGMITCILGMSACGTVEEANPGNDPAIEESALTTGDQLVETIAMICKENMQDQYSSDAVITAAFESWTSAQADMGSYVKILDHNAEFNKDGITVIVTVEGTERNANVEIIFDKEYALTSITTNVVYTFGELMEKAALNTLLGMGTVFVILILICGLIYSFKLIPKIQEAFTKPKMEYSKPVIVDHTIAQIIEKEETSDLELVAVIAAAIAASEGSLSTDGFVVRSIRKRRVY